MAEHSEVGIWIERRARAAGARLALADAERRLDYAGLHERICRCAALLEAHGVRRGERVALLLGNRTAYLEVLFAAARLGAIAVPVNARLAPPEVRFVLRDCAPRLLIHEVALAQTLERAGLPELPRLACGGPADAYESALAACPTRERSEALSPEASHLLLYTSGTTGTPKGALLPHRKTLYNSLNAEHFFGLSEADRVLVALPLFHSFGLLILSVPTLFAGGAVLLAPRFDALECWQAVARERISFLGGVPAMFRALLEALEGEPARSLDRRALRFLFSAGAALPVELIRGFERHGLLLKQGFGQTETSILCCLDARDALRKAGSVGRPVRHVELRLVDPTSLEEPPERWREVATGEAGEIVVRGPITMLGYWGRPAESAETLRGEWLRTGDLARRDEEGFLTLAGRARELYISGGENVYPAEVEAAYAAHPDLREIAVLGVPDDQWGEVGVAFLVLAPGARLDPEALRAWGAERLAAFKLPRRFVAVPALPRTATGKIQKQRLPALARAALAALLLGVAPGAPAGCARAEPAAVEASAETAPVPHSGDAADDPAIWVHPSDRARSRVIGTDKKGGIAVYDLAGQPVQVLAGAELNNVDVRTGFSLGGQPIDVAAASDRSHDAIAVYRIDPDAGRLSPLTAPGGIRVGLEAYGFCLYQSPRSGKLYGFVNAKSGQVEQWELREAGAGLVGGALVRSFSVGSQTEGCVADDEHASLFVGEEAVGIWRYGAEPDAGSERVAVDATGPGGHLAADVEGLALYRRGDGAGYLLASSQGNDQFAVYQRRPPHAWLGNFRVAAGPAIDGVSDTDGIDVTSAALGPAFPNGLFAAQDGENPPGNQNYKLVPWERIAGAFEPALASDPAFDPRAPRAAGSSEGGAAAP